MNKKIVGITFGLMLLSGTTGYAMSGWLNDVLNKANEGMETTGNVGVSDGTESLNAYAKKLQNAVMDEVADESIKQNLLIEESLKNYTTAKKSEMEQYFIGEELQIARETLGIKGAEVIASGQKDIQSEFEKIMKTYR